MKLFLFLLFLLVSLVQAADEPVIINDSIEPNFTIFKWQNGERELGQMWVDEKGFHFEGQADKASREFFDKFVKPMADNYIKEHCGGRI